MKDFNFKRGDVVDFDGIKSMVVGFKHIEDEDGIRRFYIIKLLNSKDINSVLSVTENTVSEWVEPISVGDVIPTTIAKDFFFNLPIDTVVEVEDYASDGKYVYLKTNNEGRYVRSNPEVYSTGNITLSGADMLYYYVRQGSRTKIVYMPVRTLTEQD